MNSNAITHASIRCKSRRPGIVHLDFFASRIINAAEVEAAEVEAARPVKAARADKKAPAAVADTPTAEADEAPDSTDAEAEPATETEPETESASAATDEAETTSGDDA